MRAWSQYFANRIVNVCRRNDISILYSPTVGIKCVNQLIYSEMFRPFERAAPFDSRVEDLFIGFDGLKDSSTLLDVAITRSPHFEVINLLHEGKDVRSSEYVRRSINGTLDFRSARRSTPARIECLKRGFLTTLDKVVSRDCDPIRVFDLQGKLYIVDGKHRASICSILGIEPQCVDVSLGVHDSFYTWVIRKMKKNERQYEKHLYWFDQLRCQHTCREFIGDHLL